MSQLVHKENLVVLITRTIIILATIASFTTMVVHCQTVQSETEPCVEWAESRGGHMMSGAEFQERLDQCLRERDLVKAASEKAEP